MAILANPYADPSDLDDVLECVRGLFFDAGDTTTIMIGASYEEFSAGAPPRILFVPETAGNASTKCFEAGRAGNVTDGCAFHIRGVEDGTDIGRYRSAYKLRRRVMTAIHRAGSGRVEFTKYEPSSLLKVDSPAGAQVSMAFTYQHDVPHDPEIMRVKRAPPDTTPPRPQVPPGEPASGITINVSTTPEE